MGKKILGIFIGWENQVFFIGNTPHEYFWSEILLYFIGWSDPVAFLRRNMQKNMIRVFYAKGPSARRLSSRSRHQAHAPDEKSKI
jgi:hypothetical protein